MRNHLFPINYSVSGNKRKQLVQAISDYTGAGIRYLGAPSFAYEVGCFTIDKSGRVSCSGPPCRDVTEGLPEYLALNGFTPLPQDPEPDNPLEPVEEHSGSGGLTVRQPIDEVAPDGLDRLIKLVDSKAALIKKALGADRLTILTEGDSILFPWWDHMPETEEVNAFTCFISALCAMAKEAKRVTATEKEVENEKYSFRCFLLRLGFIGADRKAERKILLRSLSGSSAFKNSQKGGADHAVSK